MFLSWQFPLHGNVFYSSAVEIGSEKRCLIEKWKWKRMSWARKMSSLNENSYCLRNPRYEWMLAIGMFLWSEINSKGVTQRQEKPLKQQPLRHLLQPVYPSFQMKLHHMGNQYWHNLKGREDFKCHLYYI
jgi:hypothetical protein